MRYCFLRFPEGRDKALTLSYDDGVKQDKRLIEIADKYGLKVTLNINSAWTDDGHHLSIEELKSITEKGNHEIAVHGAKHKAPGRVSAVHGIYDVITCRQSLENSFGKIIRGMAYPDTGITRISGGADKAEIKSYLKTLGIAYARTLGGDNDRFSLPEDFYEWMPTAHHNNPNLMNYLDKFLSAEQNPYHAARDPFLFYLWGHSYEFDDKNNWNVLEDFCRKAGNRDDIWYATNIEICDYVSAYYSLIFNTDGTLVFNPTNITVWIEADGNLITVKSGETKSLKD